MAHYLALGHVDEHKVVIFLQRDHGHAFGIHLDKLGFGVGGGDRCQIRQVDGVRSGAVGNAVFNRKNRHIASGQLGNGAFVECFVTLVFHHHHDVAAHFVERDRVRLALQIAFVNHFAGGDIDSHQVTLGLIKKLGGIDCRHDFAAQDNHRGGLTIYRYKTSRLRAGRVGNVNQADAMLFAVGVGQKAAVFTGRDDFSNRLFADRAACGYVAKCFKGGNSVEILALRLCMHGQKGLRTSDGKCNRNESFNPIHKIYLLVFIGD